MTYQTYDLDSSDSSDPIPPKPQKVSKKISQGYSNDQFRKNYLKTYDSEESEKNIPQENPKKSNQIKKSILNQKNQYDIQDSEDDEIIDDNKDTNKLNEFRQHSKSEKKTSGKKKFISEYDNEDSDNSQKNLVYIDEPNQIKSRAYSYGKSHKNLDPNLLNFDFSDNDEDHSIDYAIRKQKPKSIYSDSNSRSSTKYSKTIGGGENSLNFRSKEFSPKENQTKNLIRTNDFSSNRSQKTDKTQSKPNNSKYQYQNYDSEDSYDDQNHNENRNDLNHRPNKSSPKNIQNLTDSDNEFSHKNTDKRRIEKDIAKDSSSSSINENNDWSFPMNYVPEPDDMKEIIEDYHDKYSIDFLLRRIINNPSCKSANDE